MGKGLIGGGGNGYRLGRNSKVWRFDQDLRVPARCRMHIGFSRVCKIGENLSERMSLFNAALRAISLQNRRLPTLMTNYSKT